jgi:hypothetical protein
MLTEAGQVGAKDPSQRIQLIPSPIVSPGQCGICGISKHSVGFVTLGMDFEFYGTLIFCADCAVSLGAVAGSISPAQYQHLNDSNRELLEINATLSAEITVLQEVKNGISNYLSRYPMSDSIVGSVLGSDQPEVDGEVAPGSDTSTTGNNSGTTEVSSNAAESVSVEGSDDVSDDASRILSDLGIAD